MKTVNKVSRILALVFSIVALVLFFTNFATIVSNGQAYTLAGSQLIFQDKIAEIGQKIARSTDLWFCFWVTVISVFSGVMVLLNKKGARYAQPAFAAVSAIYMLVVSLSKANVFVDTRPFENVTEVTYASFTFLPTVVLIVIVLFASVICGVAHLLINDALSVAGTKELTIPKKIVRFFRDYKSEVKKIVWPGLGDVLKNTAIVLGLCAVIGVFIWLIDLGLVSLLSLILGK